MPIPTPEPGLIISYAYVWYHEAQTGQEEGRKDRPCVIALAAERQEDGETLVTVLPVTHRPPDNAAAAAEIPRAPRIVTTTAIRRAFSRKCSRRFGPGTSRTK